MLLPALREEIAALGWAAPFATARLQSPFRMAIDRSFTVPGHGTVVTGSVSTGRLSVGDRLVVEPGGIDVRVRGLHNHDLEVQHVSRGQRAAINLAGMHHDQVQRGHELAAPGHLVPSRLVTCHITMLPTAAWIVLVPATGLTLLATATVGALTLALSV